MKYLSVCSGIEAATCAWHPLGWRPFAFAEIEKFPSAVLANHYPNVPNLGDITRFKEWPDATIDVLAGGTPRQSFSVAGLRKGMDDPRGNLMLTFGAIAAKYRPDWLVWENVPGVLSSNGGRDFGAFLWMLGELGYGFAYRVLDAQYFGVAQRRRRVFVVGNLRDWRRAAAVLFERYSLSGHPPPRRRFGAPGYTNPAAGVPFDMLGFGQYGSGETASSLKARDYKDATDLVVCADVAPTLTSSGDANSGHLGLSGLVATTRNRVRRLTPRECERLQGFPDDYTQIPYRNKPADRCPDGPRYKALGNSMAVPVMRWIGERIDQVEQINSASAQAKKDLL